MLTSVNHIGIAVRDLDSAIEKYKNIFSIEEIHIETVSEQKVRVASFNIGGVLIELTAPTDESSPIAKYIEKRGEGIHHIAFGSDEIEDDLNRLKSNNIQLINETPSLGAHDMMIAFVHPRSTGGVLMEICQTKSEIKSEINE